MERFLKIGEISRLYHIGVDSLRYYEKIGLIHPRRSENGYRLYGDREIWKLNVIRDLRELGFPTETIGTYLEFQNVGSALQLLEEERQAIDRKMETLRKLRQNVECRLETIRRGSSLPLEQIRELELPERRCYRLEKGYESPEEMDILMKELVNRNDDQLYIIGSNRIGSILEEKEGNIGYKAVFALDSQGESSIPGGTYLSLCYGGSYEKTAPMLEKIKAYCKEHHYCICGEILELLWVDIHTTRKEEEYLTQLQIPVCRRIGT